MYHEFLMWIRHLVKPLSSSLVIITFVFILSIRAKPPKCPIKSTIPLKGIVDKSPFDLTVQNDSRFASCDSLSSYSTILAFDQAIQQEKCGFLLEHGMVLRPDGMLLDVSGGCCVPSAADLFKQNSTVFRFQTENSKIITKRAVSIIHRHSTTYFHFVWEALGRLMIWETVTEENLHPDEWDKLLEEVVVVTDSSQSFANELLQLLGYKHIHVRENGMATLVASLDVPPRESHSCKGIPRLRDRVFERIGINDVSFSDRETLLIIRRSNRSRSILNHEELFKGLTALNYNQLPIEVHFCEPNCKIEDTIKMFMQAKIIVGPHGAGMTNVIFSKRGFTLFEILSTQQHGKVYGGLSARSGGRHHYYWMHNVSENTNFHINVSDFMSFLVSTLNVVPENPA